jgi:hypothetical protein
MDKIKEIKIAVIEIIALKSLKRFVMDTINKNARKGITGIKMPVKIILSNFSPFYHFIKFISSA